MSDLLNKLRARREQWSEHEGKRLLLRRPTRLQVALWSGRPRLSECIVDWNLMLSDLIPGEPADPVPFEADAAAEWLEDNPGFYGVVVNDLREMMEKAQKQEDDLVGKSPPPSS